MPQKRAQFLRDIRVTGCVFRTVPARAQSEATKSALGNMPVARARATCARSARNRDWRPSMFSMSYSPHESYDELFLSEGQPRLAAQRVTQFLNSMSQDRKSTRLNSSHSQISYAV